MVYGRIKGVGPGFYGRIKGPGFYGRTMDAGRQKGVDYDRGCRVGQRV